MVSKAYEEGYTAACDGKDYINNPYYKDDRQYLDWNFGFMRAEFDMADYYPEDEEESNG